MTQMRRRSTDKAACSISEQYGVPAYVPEHHMKGFIMSIYFHEGNKICSLLKRQDSLHMLIVRLICTMYPFLIDCSLLR